MILNLDQRVLELITLNEISDTDNGEITGIDWHELTYQPCTLMIL